MGRDYHRDIRARDREVGCWLINRTGQEKSECGRYGVRYCEGCVRSIYGARHGVSIYRLSAGGTKCESRRASIHVYTLAHLSCVAIWRVIEREESIEAWQERRHSVR